MKKTIKQIKDTAQGVKLSAKEKSGMKFTVLEYAKMKPVREGATQAVSRKKTVLGFYVPYPKFVAGTLISLFVFTTGGGVAFASQGSLPGDILYDAKIVTEKIREVVTLNQEKKIAWIASRAERRIDESIRLAQMNELSDSVAKDLQKRFEQQMMNARERIDVLDSVRPVEAKRVRIRIQKNIASAEKRLDVFTAPKTLPVIVKTEQVAEVVKEQDKKNPAPVFAEPVATPVVAVPAPILNISNSVKEQKRKLDVQEAEYKKRNIQEIIPESVIRNNPQLRSLQKPIKREVIQPPKREVEITKDRIEEIRKVPQKDTLQIQKRPTDSLN